jgi:hypothetical protein
MVTGDDDHLNGRSPGNRTCLSGVMWNPGNNPGCQPFRTSPDNCPCITPGSGIQPRSISVVQPQAGTNTWPWPVSRPVPGFTFALQGHTVFGLCFYRIITIPGSVTGVPDWAGMQGDTVLDSAGGRAGMSHIAHTPDTVTRFIRPPSAVFAVRAGYSGCRCRPSFDHR